MSVEDRAIWTDKELAEAWKIPVRTVQQMCRDGRLASFKAGRAVRVTDRAKVAFEDCQRQGSDAA